MSFEIIILGCGSASPTSKRNPSSQYISVQNRYFLIDCGEGTQVQLRKHKIRIQKIQHIFISHLHGDHYFGLPGLLSTFHLLGRENELHIYCPHNLKQLIHSLFKVSNTFLKYSLHFHSLNFDNPEIIFEDEKVEIHSFPMKHSIDVCGFKINEKLKPRKINKSAIDAFKIPHYLLNQIKNGANFTLENGEEIENSKLTLDPDVSMSYAYCSDTAYFPDISKSIEGVDLLYHESTFTNEHEKTAHKTKHSTSEQAAKIANMCKAKKLILGHFSARYSDLDLLLNEAKSIFKNTLIAHDDMKITL